MISLTKKQFANKYSGGKDDSSFYDDILEFDPLTGQWNLVDRMIQARRDYDVSVIEYSKVAPFCRYSRYTWQSHIQYELIKYIDLIIYLCYLCCSIENYFIINHDWPLQPAFSTHLCFALVL